MVVGPISLCGVLLVGVALLWSVRLMYGGRSDVTDDTPRLVLTIVAWILIHVGALSLAAQAVFVVPDPSYGLLGWLSWMFLGVIFIAPVWLVIVGIEVVRYRGLEWASLMRLLSSAARRGVPLERAARAFGRERCDEVGLRASRLADLLGRGVDLPAALDRTKTRLPLDGILAARFGAETGDLGESIAVITSGDDDLETLVRSSLERGLYLVVVLSLLSGILTFMNLRILPVFSRLFWEFDIQLPWATEMLLEAAEFLLDYGHLFFVGVSVFLISFLVAFTYFLGWLPREFPTVSRFTLRYDGTLIMRALSVAIRQRRPMNRAIWLLSRVYPKRNVRQRLARAGRAMNEGLEWTDSLRKQRLIRRGDSAVLKAAQRVGNLEWALTEMANSGQRAIKYRLMVVFNLLFPAMLLATAAVVAVVTVSLFSPIVRLIDSLP